MSVELEESVLYFWMIDRRSLALIVKRLISSMLEVVEEDDVLPDVSA